MNYTENYQLPQWVESDRVLMDDFNDAMKKVDEALETAQTASPWIFLKKYSVSSSASEVELDVRDLDFTRYHEICIYLEPSKTTTAKTIYLSVNQETKYYDKDNEIESLSLVFINPDNPTETFCRFYVTFAGGLAGKGEYSYSTGDGSDSGSRGPYVCALQAGQLETFRLWAFQTLIGKDTQVQIYGLKKQV